MNLICHNKFWLLLLVISVFFTHTISCSSPSATGMSHDTHDHGEHDHHDHEDEDHAEEIMLTDMQAEKVGISYGKIEKRGIREVLPVNGVVALMPQKQAQASSLIAGRVEQIIVQPGDVVKKGDRLILIKNPDLIDLQQALQEVKGNLLNLDQMYERRRKLLADSVISLEAFQQVYADRQQALARKRGLSAKLNAYGLHPESERFVDEIWVRAPMSAHVDEVLVQIGASIDAMQPLVALLQSDGAHIELRVFEQDIDKVNKGQEISFSINNQPNKSLTAHIFAVDHMLEPSDRSLRVFAQPIDPEVKLLPGMYITAGISLGETPQNCVPSAAIAKDKALAYIFVKEDVHEGEIHFRKLEVLLGQQDRNFIAIEPVEALAADAEIVVNGAFYLLAQSKKGEEGGGHSHAH